ncbi:hypothetical protein BDV37DRAFT_262453 [Aspergillus pseudonomiae]|uniref:Uncharacterized protein n=1 Tax=Aspergillus pseudonomiae TaxID=1506151 RepID=A0A5N7CX91_9EURO|nr:uncharacterized protein BDV37DRAFT_262453 [Aspergillus pseudonomiae]KAE8398800.1 hypothetical protein BDV37DRAFT_262453 [Aspergillus pseudonomiae]
MGLFLQILLPPPFFLFTLCITMMLSGIPTLLILEKGVFNISSTYIYRKEAVLNRFHGPFHRRVAYS